MHTEEPHMKAILLALVVTSLLVFTSYRAMTFEPDAYATPADAGLQRSMDSDNGPWL